MDLGDGATIAGLLALAAVIIIDVVALLVIPRDRKPTAAMAWLLLIIALPVLGLLLFLLIGNASLPRRRRDDQAKITALIRRRARPASVRSDLSRRPRWVQRVIRMNESLTALPMVQGNRWELIDDYAGSIAAMTSALHRAERFVHVEFFIVALDESTRGFFDAMAAAVRRGVSVRLLADQVASRRIPLSKETFAELDRIGVSWSWMLPVEPLRGRYQRPDLRNHRKIVVIDGVVGFTGSQNLIDRSYDSTKNRSRGLQWQELVVRVDGPAAAELNAVFLTDWLIETGQDLTTEATPVPSIHPSPAGRADAQVVPSGPGYPTENNLRLFLALIHGATERVIITSPYFVPDEAMVYAITNACHRGLEVHLFVSEIGDQGLVYHAQRSYYRVLLEAGVRIFLYPAPYILHAKHLSIDDDVAVIGSSNMDIRSFSLNMEVSLLVHDRAFVDAMREIEQRYRDAGRELTLEEWRREPARATFLDGLARLTSALN